MLASTSAFIIPRFQQCFMDQYDEIACIRTSQDSSHFGKYEMELGAEITGSIDLLKAALESSGYVLVDFDQWGYAYLSGDDPDLTAEVNDLNDYVGKCRLTFRRGRLLEDEIGDAREYVRQIYNVITNRMAVEVIESV